MFKIPDLILVVFAVLCFFGFSLYDFLKRYNYWNNLKVPFTGFRNDCKLFLHSKAHGIRVQYNELAPYKFGGIYQSAKPFLVIRDPELIRNILIKDFTHFTDRGIKINEKNDPLAAHLINLTGHRWRKIRYLLSPNFSSGKLKVMDPLVEECVRILEEQLKRDLEDTKEVEVEKTMLNFAANYIGTCAFGTNCSSIDDRNSEIAEVFELLRQSRHSQIAKTVVQLFFSRLSSLLNQKDMPQKVEDFFKKLTRESRKDRAEDAIKRSDFMQLLIDAQHEEIEKKKESNMKEDILFTDDVISANVYVFFSAGHESIAETIGFCLYELALNPEVMERLHGEIKETRAANGGKLNYETLQEMDYMQCVISETMRKHPAAPKLKRQCTKSYKIPDSSFTIEEKTSVIIPVQGLHYDPKYFPDPEKFDPERFNEQNKRKIVPGTYLPFGKGPRICIGMRFALIGVKAVLAMIIGNYTVHPTEKTQIPMKYKVSVLNIPEKGIHLRFQARERSTLKCNQSGQKDNSNKIT